MADLNLDNVTFDQNRISAADTWDFERESGGVNLQEFVQALERGEISEDTMFRHLREIVAFVWIAVRQSNPEVTFDEVARHPLIPLFNSLAMQQSGPAAAKPRKKAAAKVA